jgi:homoserine acetyltransferase
MGVVPMPADFGAVENQSFTISSFRPQNGAVMPQAKVAYETYGSPMAPKAQNVEQSLTQLVARSATDPEWNGGQYYDGDGPNDPDGAAGRDAETQRQ